MIDKDSKFLAILTAVGEAKLANAIGLGLPWHLTEMGVGDANDTDPIPDRLQTALIHEQRRAPLNQLRDDEANPGLLIAEQIIPADVGGWWVRELGLYDIDGDLVAVANCAPSYKPLLEQGSGRTQVVRMTFIVSSTANVVLKIDPAVVLATREYVDRSIDIVLPANKPDGSYRKVTVNARGIVISGSNPTTLDEYEISDAYTKAQTDSAISFAISEKADKATTIDGYGITDAYTKAQADSAISSAISEKADKATTIDGYGITDAYTKAEADSAISSAISKKADKATTIDGYGITDAIAKGQYGLGATLIPAGAIDYKDLPGGFYSIEDQWSSFGSFLSVLNLPSWAKGFPAQLGIEVGGAQAKAFIRSAGNGGEWLPPSELWTSANFNPATKLDSAGIVMSLGPNGFLAFPSSLGRLIIQWGTVGAQSQTAHTVTFPQAYNSACFGVITSVNNSAGSINGDSGYQVISKTNQNFTAFRQDYNATNTGDDSGYTWFSFGV